MDCSRAFDLARWCTIFSRVLDKEVPPLVVRLLIFIYEEQIVWVQWGDAMSGLTVSPVELNSPGVQN